MEPLDRIEFAFVLLPDDTILGRLQRMAQTVHFLIQGAPFRENVPVEWGMYANQPLRMPHLSIGQYGMLGCERDVIIKITKEVSFLSEAICETMNKTLTVLYLFSMIFSTRPP